MNHFHPEQVQGLEQRRTCQIEDKRSHCRSQISASLQHCVLRIRLPPLLSGSRDDGYTFGLVEHNLSICIGANKHPTQSSHQVGNLGHKGLGCTSLQHLSYRIPCLQNNSFWQCYDDVSGHRPHIPYCSGSRMPRMPSGSQWGKACWNTTGPSGALGIWYQNIPHQF